MKKLKILILVLVLIVGLLVAAVVGGFVFIDSLARNGIERGATYALEVPTTLDSADINIFGGKFGLSGLTISNPEGYSTPHFLSLGTGSAALNLSTLQQDTVEIPSLVLEGIDVYLDKENGKANYEVILDNLKRFESGEAPADKPAEAPSEDAPKKKFVIRELIIRDVTAHVELLPIGGNLSTAEVKVPEIILTDVGEKDPVTIAKLTNVIIKAVFASVLNVGAGVLPQGITDGLNAGLGGLADLASGGIGMGIDLGEGVVNVVGDVGGAALGAAGDAAGAIGDGAEEAVGRIGGLLGIGKDDKKKTEEDTPAEETAPKKDDGGG